ncbi:cysteine-rich small domain-containing protein [Desulfovibrio inopinatus]|uniref:cysteine-rich small domain-containing protein n=1 Tax=Desulfovibrio inopinatus TaxID=102109 RepID=UPI000A039577|nr:cysteine-rich small domain-containing protein [Desulfovibrio inopinatus]
MEHSFKYYKNTSCRYYPCHECDPQADFNCLFCFCPLYFFPDCGGNPQLRGAVKDCSQCTLPHSTAGYDHIVAKLKTWFAEGRPEAVRNLFSPNDTDTSS